MLTIGKQLAQARLTRKASIEDIAFETRIPARKLREMENDDLSNFANLTYAKGFLKLYSRHLGLDFSDYLDQFDTSALASVNGHEYAVSLSVQKRSMPPGAAYAPPTGSKLPVLTVVSAVVFLLVGSVIFVKFRQHRQQNVTEQVAEAPPEPTPAPAAAGSRSTLASAHSAEQTPLSLGSRTPTRRLTEEATPAPPPRAIPVNDVPLPAPAALRPRIVEEDEPATANPESVPPRT